MATDNNNSSKSPRVKIRWCRTVRCISKEVYLVLAAYAESQVSLTWKDELGWYESDFVSLPTGLHSGYLLIREKILSYIFQPRLQEISTTKEREYKIDPFFVTPQKYCVELFIDSSRTQNGRNADSANVHQRFFSSQLLGPQSKNAEQEKSPRKWSSSHELRGSSEDDVAEKDQAKIDSLDDVKGIKEGLNGKISKEKFPEVSYGALQDRLESPSYSASNLRKCISLDDKRKIPHKISSDDSSISRSLYFDDDSRLKSNFRADTFKSEGSRAFAGKSFCHLANEESTLHSGSQRRSSKSASNSANSETIAQVKNIVDLLKSSHEEKKQQKCLFKELDPQEESERGYGCLITFESCSSSMDDLGSPRALEEVIVSITSSDTEANKYSGQFRDIEVIPIELARDNVQLQSTINNKQINEFILGNYLERKSIETDDRSNVEENSVGDFSGTDKSDSKYPESDITINEDENFQYDSLKHDDQTIPLNIREVLDSEDSLEYSVNDSKEPEIQQESHRFSVSGNSNGKIQSSDSSNSTLREVKSNTYSCKEPKKYPNSVNNKVASSPLILVHPGSLRSETDNNGSGTYVVNSESDSTPSEIELFKAVNTVRKLSASLKTIVKPPEPTAIEVQKLTPSKKTKIVIVRDKRPPTMNSGTQTSYRDSCPKVIDKSSRLRTRSQRDQKYSSSSSTLNNTSSYTPLPDKVQGPWSSKYQNPKIAEEQFRKSILEKFKQNFRNLAKVENILKNINHSGFDYEDSENNCYEDGKTAQMKNFSQSHMLRKSKDRRCYTRQPYMNSNISLPAYTKPSVSFRAISPKSSDSFYDFHRSRDTYSSTRLKEVAVPIFSIYGKEAARSSFTQANNQRYRTPVLKTSVARSAIRPTSSLPDVREGYEEYGSPRLIVSQKFRRRSPFNALRSTPKSNSESPYRFRRIRGRSSDSLLLHQKDLNSSGSTESLIDEAIRFSNSSGLRTDDEQAETFSKSPPFRRRARAQSAGCVQTSLVSHRSASPNWASATTSPRLENSISSALRTRSDTDLRMVGLLAAGYKGLQPYLPYSKRELSVGQVVKVLVPGEGVAMARIVYAPPDDKFMPSRFNDNIAVLLISEPTNLSGSIINVPMNKILLAWPKSLL